MGLLLYFLKVLEIENTPQDIEDDDYVLPLALYILR
jgi:hypothetical protein